MAIQDLANNPLVTGSQAQMLGYSEPPAPEEVLNLDMYRFLIEPIRREDVQRGGLFVKRYLQGPQALWLQTQTSLFDIKKLWSLTECPDDYLQYLKNIVGWTPRYDNITSALDAATLRRLIATSIPLWRRRGAEDTLLDVLTLVTGARQRLWNWFYFRWIVGETVLSEVHEGADSWAVGTPGTSDAEYTSNLRIVDDGTLDRAVVRQLLNLMRPIGERFEVTYLLFLDEFTVVGDTTQWGGTGPTVTDGIATLPDDGVAEAVLASVNGNDTWGNYLAYWCLKSTITTAGALVGGTFYATDVDNAYRVGLDILNNRVKLLKIIGGTPTTLADVDYGAWSTLVNDLYYGVRVQATPEGGTTRIKVYLDNDLVINVTDSEYSQGTVGLFHDAGVAAAYDEVELMPLPSDSEIIDINA